jgi:hypothetical protein
MPSISQGIYWYTATVTYQVGNILFLIYLGMLYHNLTRKSDPKPLDFVSLIIIQLLSIGCNELTMISVFTTTLVVYIISIVNKQNKKTVSLLLSTTIIFCLAVYFAPGNSVREIELKNEKKIIFTLIQSLLYTFHFIFEKSSSLTLILLAIIYYPINDLLSKKIELFKSSFYLTPIKASLLLILLVFTQIFALQWSVNYLPERSLNVTFLVFILAVIIFLTVIFNRLKSSTNIITSKIKYISLYILLLSIISSNNYFNLIKDFSKKKPQRYDQEIQDRHLILRKKSSTTYLPLIHTKPKTLYVSDISENSTNWINNAYALFFNKPINSVHEKTK